MTKSGLSFLTITGRVLVAGVLALGAFALGAIAYAVAHAL